MKRWFRNFRDDRFALTTLQNPNLEVRTYAELVQAAQREREIQQAAAPSPATQAPATPSAWLPPAQAAIPAVAGLPAEAGDQILIASGPNIKNRCKPLKTLTGDPC
jgi:hypothetical protein